MNSSPLLRRCSPDQKKLSCSAMAASASNAKTVVSPDGCQLAVSIYGTFGDGRPSSVAVTSFVDGSTTMQIPDALLLGWADMPADSQQE